MRVLVLCVLCACGRLGFGGAELDAEPSDLVLHAAFDSDGLLRDRASGHTLSCAACPLQVGGRIGEAAMFDATTCIEVSDAVDLRVAEYTYAAWASSIANQGGTVVGRPQDGVNLDGNTFQMYIADDQRWRLQHNSVDLLIATTTPDTWHHMVATYDGTMFTLYIDGALAAGPVAAGVVQYTADNIMIGCDRDFGAVIGHWRGLIDEVRLYSRALTATEIAGLATF